MSSHFAETVTLHVRVCACDKRQLLSSGFWNASRFCTLIGHILKISVQLGMSHDPADPDRNQSVSERIGKCEMCGRANDNSF